MAGGGNARNRSVATVCIAVMLAVASARGAGAALRAPGAPLRIMALGDSITAGVGTNGAPAESGGYRGVLAQLLQRGDVPAVFVGSRTDYSDAIDERAHEGWPGYVVRSFASDPGPGQLLGPVVHNAIRANTPDVILLMAGTNDLLRLQNHTDGYTLPNILHSMDLLIDEIVTDAPAVDLIVAPVVASPKIDACTLSQFAGDAVCGPVGAESLRTIVEAYARRGYHVTLAPGMATAVPRDAEHFPDGIHPSGAGGYAAVAAIWFDAIEHL